MKGLRKYLTPFAPDQSGAVSVLYEYGGMLVILDAGGCTGNVCGFDEPRWSGRRSAVFSAGLRDMDAIMGRDRELVRKMKAAAERMNASFAALIGTPVPSVIGTDYRALKRMLEKEIGIPVLAVPTNGMALYDAGAEQAYLELFRNLAAELPEETNAAQAERRIGILGCSPLDLASIQDAERIRSSLKDAGYAKTVTYGMDSVMEDVQRAGLAEKNLVISPAGLKAARYLKERFGTEYEMDYPAADHYLADTPISLFSGKRTLILHQQVFTNAIRKRIRAALKGEPGFSSGEDRTALVCGSWFMTVPELTEPGDLKLSEEDDFTELMNSEQFDVIIADPVFRKMAAGFQGSFIPVPEFSVSGR